jgi:hypothetical protein
MIVTATASARLFIPLPPLGLTMLASNLNDGEQYGFLTTAQVSNREPRCLNRRLPEVAKVGRSSRHHQHERPLPLSTKAAILAVAGETDEHSWRLNFDVGTEQQAERRDQQLATNHTEQSSNNADHGPGDDAQLASVLRSELRR